MDKTAIWCRDGIVSECNDVRLRPEAGYTYLSDNTRLITLFLYMVSELSALQQIINALTGLNGLPAVIVECFVTTVYTCMSSTRYHPPSDY